MGRRRIRERFRAPLLIAALAVSAAACQPKEPPQPPPAAPPTPAAVLREARELLIHGNAPAAEKLLAGARHRYGQGDRDETALALRVAHGEAHFFSFRLEQAEEVWKAEPPAALAETAPGVRWLILTSYGGNGDRLERAAKVAEARYPELIPEIYNARSRKAGIPEEEAIAHAQAALKLAKKRRDEYEAGQALAFLAKTSCDSEDFVDCILYGEEALSHSREHGFKRLTAKSGNLAWGYVELGELETAYELFLEAERGAAAVGDNAARVAWLNQLANVNHMRRNFPEAKRYYDAALELARRVDHVDTGAILTNLARLGVDTGDLQTANALIAEALVWKEEKKKPETSLMHSHLVQARILGAEKRYDDAEKLLGRIAREVELDSLKWEAEGRLAMLFHEKGDAARAEKLFEDALRTAATARASITDKELRLTFASVISEVFAAYLDFLVASGRADRALLVADSHRAQTLAEDLGLRRGGRAIVPADVAKRHNAVILYYALGPERSYLWTIAPSSVRVTTLPAENEINTAVERYQRVLRGANGTLENTRGDGEKLFRTLVAPAAIARGTRVLVIPDGRLHALNFETLVNAGDYWIEDVTISHASSLQLVDRAQEPWRSRSLLLVGDAPEVDPGFPKLESARAELDNVARPFDPAATVTLAGAGATPAAFHAADPAKFDIIHFVAHGFATRKRPLDSAVILGRDRSGEHKLLARDIVSTRLGARLVTISSCHGAGTRDFAGEGLVGLAWAFLGAGADEVIAALWEVDDSLTPDLMQRMYAELAAGVAPAEALRTAKLAMVRGRGKQSRAVYWAPFIHYF